MGCIMARTCHRGNCPAGITSALIRGSKIVEYESARIHSRNFLIAFMKELALILDYLGINDIRKLVSKRDLLTGKCINGELAEILGVRNDDSCDDVKLIASNGQLWSPDYLIYANQLSIKGSPIVVSMGSTGPPEVDPPRKLLDWIRFDGAQVTKPAIDPYRENVDTSIELIRGGLRVTVPIVLRPLGHLFTDKVEVIKLVTKVTGVAVDLTGIMSIGNKHLSNVIWDKFIEGLGVFAINYDRAKEQLPSVSVPLYIRVGTNVNVEELINFLMGHLDRVYGIIIDEDLSNSEFIEVFLVNLDRGLRRVSIRYDVDLLVHMRSIRSSGDVVKLMVLGANAVEISALLERSLHGYSGLEDFTERLIRFVLGVRREVALMLGAAGVYSMSSIVGNRELLRTLDPRVKHLLHVKVAGET
jgi:hypothetical protein